MCIEATARLVAGLDKSFSWNPTYSLHCSSFLGLPYRILIIFLNQRSNYNGDYRQTDTPNPQPLQLVGFMLCGGGLRLWYVETARLLSSRRVGTSGGPVFGVCVCVSVRVHIAQIRTSTEVSYACLTVAL